MHALPIGRHLLAVAAHANELAVLCRLAQTPEEHRRGRAGLEDMARQVRILGDRVAAEPQNPGVYKDQRRVRNICRSIYREAKRNLDDWQRLGGDTTARHAGDTVGHGTPLGQIQHPDTP